MLQMHPLTTPNVLRRHHHPCGLGLRCEGYVDGSVQTEADKSKVEFRILNFKIVP